MKYEVTTEIDTKDLKGRRLEFDYGYKAKITTGTIVDVIPAGVKATPNQLRSFYGELKSYPLAMQGPAKVDRILVRYFNSNDEKNHFIVIPLSRGGMLHWKIL